MPRFWINRNRRDRRSHHHHHHHSDVGTTGPRVIAADDGHGHRGGDTVLAASATNVSRSHRHRSSRDRHRYYTDDPSTIHGLWNKALGTLTGNRRQRRHGDREMRKARERREAVRTAEGVQRVREGDHMNKLRKSREPQESGHHHHSHGPTVIAQPRERGPTPWLHYHRRTPPPYHGVHHHILGFFTGDREKHTMGRAMAAAAEEERRREREHRHAEMRDHGKRYREGRSWWT